MFPHFKQENKKNGKQCIANYKEPEHIFGQKKNIQTSIQGIDIKTEHWEP